MTPSGPDALLKLKNGNELFSNPSPAGQAGDSPLTTFTDLSAGQTPFAAVLACSDSRVPVEAIFSQGPGEIFVVRVAGNVVGPVQLGSLEFAVDELGIQLIMVMGHTGCGAIGAALASAADGAPAPDEGSENIDALLEPILEVLTKETGSLPAAASLPSDTAVRLNVRGACDGLLDQSPVLAARAQAGELLVVGSIYDLKTGRVEFL